MARLSGSRNRWTSRRRTNSPSIWSLRFFAPTDTGVDHLKALALVSRTLRDQTLCNKLRANGDPATLYTILTEAAETKAA